MAVHATCKHGKSPFECELCEKAFWAMRLAENACKANGGGEVLAVRIDGAGWNEPSWIMSRE